MMTSATEAVLLVVAASIAVVTAGLGILTLVMTWWNRRTRRRIDKTREQVQERLFGQLFESEPDWDGLIADLSPVEREQLHELVEAQLRRFRGTEYDRLCNLARKLGIPAEAKDNLETGQNRFRALTWLALLGEPVERRRLQDCCTERRRHRDGAARLLFESDQPEGPTVGTGLLLRDGSRPLSAFGMDTLYRLNNGDQTPLLAKAPSNVATWNSQLLIQVLTVLRYCSIREPVEQLDWLLELLDHDSPQIRAATVGVIERHGWRDPFQSQIDIAELLADPEPSVRYDVYHLLASWGSEQSARWLNQALESADGREMLAVVRALSRHPRASLPAATGRPEPFVEWVQAEADIGRRHDPTWGVTAAWT